MLVLASAWLIAVGFTFNKAMQWEARAGQSALRAPAAAPFSRKVRLILVVHTMCPCSKATLDNLLTLSKSELAALDTEIVCTGPDAKPGSSAVNVQKATHIPGARVIYVSEQEAVQRYGARTSGQAFVFNASGRLLFSGGLTAGRGTPGESAGMEALQEAIHGKPCIAHAPVYGCALETPGGRV